MIKKILQKSQLTLKYFLAIILLIGLFLIGNSLNSNDSNSSKLSTISKKDFAICLNKKGLVMYGEDTCQYCQIQKKMFGDAFREINYINCQFEKDICTQNGITKYPAWKIKEEKRLGVQTFTSLSDWSGCTQPQ